jgi:hypothetical protein
VLGPALAIDNKPGLECFKVKFSSNNGTQETGRKTAS